MRILIVAHGFPPTHSAGAERRAGRMAYWLAEQGYDVEVFAVEKVDAAEPSVDTRQEHGVTVHRLHYNVWENDNLFVNLYDSPVISEALQALLATRHFDLAHVVCGYLMGAAAIDQLHAAGVPFIITLTEYWFMCHRLNLIQNTGNLCSGPENAAKCARCLLEEKRRYRLPALYASSLMDVFWDISHNRSFMQNTVALVEQRDERLRAALAKAERVICPSRYLMAKFKKFQFDTSRFTFLRQGLTIPDELPPRKHKQWGLRLGYLGQIKYHKGVDLLIDALLPLLDNGANLSLELWGSQTEEPDFVNTLQERTRDYPTIRWKGRYTGAAVWDVLAGVDAIVVPSRWYENSPNVILEAFRMGVPVIATDLGGMAELVKDGENGLLFTLNEADHLRQQVQRLLDEAPLLDYLRNGIPLVKSIDEEMTEIITYYEQLLPARH